MSEEISSEETNKQLVIQPGGGADWDDLDALEETVVEAEENAIDEAAEKEVALQEKVEEKQAVKDAVDELKDKGVEAEVSSDGNTIEVKVNGEIQQVGIDELKSNYAGKVVWEQKFTELDKERKAFQSDLERVDGNLKDIVKLAKGDKPEMALAKLALLMNEDPETFVKTIYEKSLKQAEMSEEDQQRFLAEQRLAFEKEDLERKRQELEQTRTQGELKGYLAQKQASLGVDDKRVEDTLQYLNEKQFFAQVETQMGRKPSEREVVDLIFNQIELTDKYSLIGEAAKEVNPELLKDNEAIKALGEVVKRDFTKEDVVDIIKEVYGGEVESDEADEEVEAKSEEETSEDSSKKPKKKKKQAKSEEAPSTDESDEVPEWMEGVEDDNPFFD